MRIIQVTDYGSPFPGSFAPMLAAALGEAVSRGWRPQLVLPARAREREWLSILAEHQERIVFAPVGARRARRRWLAGLAAAEPGPTILHSHFSVFDYAVAAIARRRRDVRAFWHLHTVLSDSLSIRLANRFKLGVASRPVERLLCVAPHLAEEVVRRGAPPDKVLYFPNGLDTAAFSPADDWRRAASRELLGLPQDAVVLLHFGRDWLAKGGDYFLEAVRLVRQRNPAVVALCARGGEAATALAAELGIAESVFVRERADTQDLYAASDLLVASSRGEGMPLTVLEALASGLPVVATDIPGHHIPDADLPSLTIAPLDADAIAAALEAQLGSSSEAAAHAAERSGLWLVENMDVGEWAKRLMDLYEAPIPVARR